MIASAIGATGDGEAGTRGCPSLLFVPSLPRSSPALPSPRQCTFLFFYLLLLLFFLLSLFFAFEFFVFFPRAGWLAAVGARESPPKCVCVRPRVATIFK